MGQPSSIATRAAFVWRSTAASVAAGTFSLLALAEVALAVGFYLVISDWLGTQALLWTSAVIAPLLLLRSEESVALGVRWFEGYVDRSFADVAHLPKNVFRSIRFLSSVFLEWIATVLAAFLLARYLLPTDSVWATVLHSLVVGYVASQAALAIIVVEAATEVMAQAETKMAAAIVGGLLVIAMAIGVAASGQGLLAIITACTVSIALTLTGVLQAPPAIASAMKLSQDTEQGRVRGIPFARAALKNAGLAFAVFAPGICVGGWLRSLAIRFVATIRYIRPGLVALPENWYRTLFVIDFCQPPEIIPGYTRSDVFNISHFLSRIRNSESIEKRYVSLIGSAILFLPAYFYRLSIKSTCWVYLPLIYMARAPKLAHNPAYLSDLLWRDVKEWMRRLVLLATLVGLLVTNLAPVQEFKALLPPVTVSPLEFMFLIDVKNIKPWQWLNITDATLTLFLLFAVSELRIMVKHDRDDDALRRSAHTHSVLVEYMLRGRNVVTWLFLLVVFVHAILWAFPLEERLPQYFADLLRSFYGTAMPPTRLPGGG